MGKKKRKVPKVWCYYCEREFDDEKILVQHQKAKHFKCHVCHKKLSTAGGMAIHVLQVHKENVTKVPNAKPDRESTEIDIFGMEGIPPEILAAHDEQFEDDKSSKIQKVEVPPSGFGGIGLGSPAIRPPLQPTYPVASSMYNSPVPLTMRPPGWPIPASSQPWSSQPPGVPGQSPLMSARPSHFSQPLQPLFPIQSSQLSTPPVPQPSHGQMLQRPSVNPTQPLFPIQNNPPLSSALSPMPSQSAGQTLYSPSPVTPSYSTPQSQALFPINGQYSTTPVSSVLPLQTSPGLQQITTPVLTTSRDYSTATMLQSPPMKDNSSAFLGTLPTSAPTPSHMYALGPNTGGPSIGPPPVISNKPPSVQAATAKEVYLVWDDEAMSMEERRMTLTKYQVHDETSQMNSVDAAIDRRILESRLAGRMGFGI